MSAPQFKERLTRVARRAQECGIDAVLVTPGTDLRYLIGYDAVALERLTCLVIPAMGEPWLTVPYLEQPAAEAAGVSSLGIELTTWTETQSPYELLASRLSSVRTVALDDHMWASKVLSLRDAMPQVRQVSGESTLSYVRMRKGADEIASLQAAGAAIDTVHRSVPDLLKIGRTEREVGADIARAILDAGHSRVDFVIVGSGPNGASPHHELSNRVIEDGDVVVVDIGGTMPDGYCSDSTRTYLVGDSPEPEYFAALQQAQAAAVAAVRPGLSCAALDAVGRDILMAAGWGEYFIHRTGHGIGLDTHEEPYIVSGNELALEPGMAFSIEPGVYLPGMNGARIEDIVVCGADGPIVCNHTPHELVRVAQ